MSGSPPDSRNYRQPAQERLRRVMQEKKKNDFVEKVYTNSELAKVVLTGLKSSLKKKKKVGNVTPSSLSSRSPRSGASHRSPRSGAVSLALASNDPPRRPRIDPKNPSYEKPVKIKSPIRPPPTVDEEDMTMDWEPILPSQAVEKTRNVRKHLDDDGEVNEINFQGKVLDLNMPPSSLSLYVVLDTNILISSLTIASYLMVNKIFEMKPILVVPWQVLVELDTLKAQRDSASVKTAHSAREASTFLLKNHDEILFQPQSKWKENAIDFDAKIGDDRVIVCGLQLLSTGHNAIILSNDKNLILKARVTRIHALAEKDLTELIKDDPLPVYRMSKMERELRTDQKTFPLFKLCHEFAKAFHSFLSTTVQYFLKTKFLNMWIFNVTIKPPWSLQDVIQLTKTYWDEASALGPGPSRNLEILDELKEFFQKDLDENLLASEVKSALNGSIQLASSLPSTLDSIGNMYIGAIRNLMDKHQELLASVDVTKQERVERLTNIFDKVERIASQLIGSLCKFFNVESPVNADIVPKPSLEQIVPYIPDTVKTIKELLSAIQIIKLQHHSTINVYSQGVSEIFATLTEFMAVHGLMPLEIDDVVAFATNDKIRNGFETAITSLEQYLICFSELEQYMQSPP